MLTIKFTLCPPQNHHSFHCIAARLRWISHWPQAHEGATALPDTIFTRYFTATIAATFEAKNPACKKAMQQGGSLGLEGTDMDHVASDHQQPSCRAALAPAAMNQHCPLSRCILSFLLLMTLPCQAIGPHPKQLHPCLGVRYRPL